LASKRANFRRARRKIHNKFQILILAQEHKMNNPSTPEAAAKFIDERIASLPDWRGKTFARVRALIHAADPDILEEVKWRGTPVFSHEGIVCTGETYKAVVKLTFAKGAALKDPARLFNSSLEGNVRRAIDIRENEKLNEPALKALIREAVTLNLTLKPSAKPKSKSKPKPKPKSSR
jgi:hypothetical protein